MESMDKRDILSLIEKALKNNTIRDNVGQLLVHRDLLKIELLVRKCALPRKNNLEEKIRSILASNPQSTTREVIDLCPEVSSKTVRRYLKKIG